MIMRFAIILFALLCASCTSTIPSIKPYRLDIQQGNVVTSKMMSQLRPGMTKSQVRFILGTPLIQDSFHSNRWDYFYQMRKGGTVIEQRRVILDFDNDLLKGVRGDVIPSQGESEEVSSAMPVAPAVPVVAEEKKGLVDKLKFWDKDAKPAENAKPLVSSETKLKVPPALVEGASAAESPSPLAVAQTSTALVAAAPEPSAPEAKVEPEKVDQQEVSAAIPPRELPAPPSDSSTNLKAVPLSTEELSRPEVVAARVNGWADAWRNKNVAAYLQFYSDKFIPDASPSKKAWIAQRKQRLTKAGKIELELDGLKVSLDGQTATAEFTQKYSAQGYSDSVNKVIKLNLERDNSNRQSNWFIVKETALKEVLLPPVTAVAAAIIAQKMPKESISQDASNTQAAAVDNDVVLSRVSAWADAWRSKDVDGYLSFYADQFIPEGVPNKKAWLAQRKQRLAKPGPISLDLDGVKANIEGVQAKVTFVQRYSANGYSDNVSKLLVLQRIDNKWLIVKESVSSKLIKIDAADGSAEMQAPKLSPQQKSEAMPEYPVEPVPIQPMPAESPQTDVATEPAPKPAPEINSESSVPKSEDKSSEAKRVESEAPPEPKPSLFERMLEKIGF